MSLLPTAGLYRYKTTKKRFLYARGFHPSWLPLEPPEPRPLYLWSKDGLLFREISRQEQKKFLDYHLLRSEVPRPWLVAVGSVPETTALQYATYVANERVRRFGWQALYCVNCALEMDEILEVLEEEPPILLVLHNVDGHEDTARDLLHRFSNALRFVILPTQSPLVYCLERLKQKPDNIILF